MSALTKKSRRKKTIIKQTDKYISYSHLDKIGEVAVYYGFTPKQSPIIKKSDLDCARTLLEGDYIDNEESNKARLPLHVEKISLLRMYQEENMHSLLQPLLFYFKEPFKSSLKKKSDSYRYSDLEIIGNSRSIAEATLIQTTKVMLALEGYENIRVEINSIGDKDSIARFARDLTIYYRKHINDMHAECRQLLKKDPFELLGCQNEKCKKINEDAPRAMNFLSEPSRAHFQEVLEYLEALNIPYKINNNLIGNRKYCTETIFTIVNSQYEKEEKEDNPDQQKDSKIKNKISVNKKILAVGVRYDGLSRKMGIKREIQGVGISLLIKGNRGELRKEIKKVKKPFVSFVQLGLESKMLSLSVIEKLRQVKIPLYLSLAKDRLGAQVSAVEKNHNPYSIIMGKKEALEKTVIVRNINTHAQDIVSLDELAKYMKRLER